MLHCSKFCGKDIANNNKESNWGIGIVAIAMLMLAFSWLRIPSASVGEIDEIHLASFAFADGLLDGWADELAIKLFHSDNPFQQTLANLRFRTAVDMLEQQHPTMNAIFLLLGSIFSVGGMIAVWVARNADNEAHAFKLGFWAEIAEFVAYHTGYYSTMQRSALSGEEILITLCVACLMGYVAKRVYRSYCKQGAPA